MINYDSKYEQSVLHFYARVTELAGKKQKTILGAFGQNKSTIKNAKQISTLLFLIKL